MVRMTKLRGQSVRTRHLASSLEARLFGVRAPVRLGRFEIEERIGAGGMGVVYRAIDPELDRTVAVKLLSRRSATKASRLRKEARALARLNHPNVVAVYEVGQDGDEMFVAMEYVSGGTLRDWCDRHPQHTRARRRQLVGLLRQAATGLAAAHEAGIVHRDLKPGNILVSDDMRLRLADFGLATPASTRLGRPTHRTDVPESDTLEGAIVGTPAYMSPEQLNGDATAASDQFSLCVTFAEALTGRHPFHDDAGCVENIRHDRIVNELKLPRRLRRTLLRGMANDPSARFEDIHALIAALDGRPRRTAVIVLGVTVVAATTMAASREPAPCIAEESLLGDAWTPRRQDAIEAALLSSSANDAPTRWLQVHHDFDRAVEQWREANRQACARARSHEPELAALGERGLACSQRAARALRRASASLLNGDHQTAQRASAVARALPRLIDCSEASVPVDARAQRIAALLDDANLAQKLGDPRTGARKATEVLAATERGELPGLREKAWSFLAWQAKIRGDYTAQREHLVAALSEAELAGDSGREVKIWGDLAVLEARAGDLQQAEFFIERARTYVDTGRVNPTRIAGVAMTEGQVAEFAGDSVGAEAAFGRAVQECRKTWPGSVLLGWALSNHALSLLALDRIEAATSTADESVKVMTAAAGPHHPDTAVTLARRGRIQVADNQPEAAAQSLQEALTILRANPDLFAAEREAAEKAWSRIR